MCAPLAKCIRLFSQQEHGLIDTGNEEEDFDEEENGANVGGDGNGDECTDDAGGADDIHYNGDPEIAYELHMVGDSVSSFLARNVCNTSYFSRVAGFLAGSSFATRRCAPTAPLGMDRCPCDQGGS